MKEDFFGTVRAGSHERNIRRGTSMCSGSSRSDSSNAGRRPALRTAAVAVGQTVDASRRATFKNDAGRTRLRYVAALLLPLLLTACGQGSGGNNANSTPSSAATPPPVTTPPVTAPPPQPSPPPTPVPPATGTARYFVYVANF